MLTEEEAQLLCDQIGFEPLEFEQFIADAIEDPGRYTDPAYELETMAKAAKGLLALWRAERIAFLALSARQRTVIELREPIKPMTRADVESAMEDHAMLEIMRGEGERGEHERALRGFGEWMAGKNATSEWDLAMKAEMVKRATEALAANPSEDS